MNKYKCVEDLQGANYMVGSIKTLEGWKQWLLESISRLIEDIIHYERLSIKVEEHHLYKEAQELKDDEVIPYIEKTYEIKFKEV